MVRVLVRAHDLPYTRYFIYWVDTCLYLFSLVNDLGVTLTLASFSVRSPGSRSSLDSALSREPSLIGY